MDLAPNPRICSFAGSVSWMRRFPALSITSYRVPGSASVGRRLTSNDPSGEANIFTGFSNGGSSAGQSVALRDHEFRLMYAAFSAAVMRMGRLDSDLPNVHRPSGARQSTRYGSIL